MMPQLVGPIIHGVYDLSCWVSLVQGIVDIYIDIFSKVYVHTYICVCVFFPTQVRMARSSYVIRSTHYNCFKHDKRTT